MLLKFEVSNFRSFNKLQEFSMFAGDSRNNPDHITKINNMHVLKNAVFYGANAGGHDVSSAFPCVIMLYC